MNKNIYPFSFIIYMKKMRGNQEIQILVFILFSDFRKDILMIFQFKDAEGKKNYV